MPRGFSEQEKTAIRQTLLAKGREMFGAYGLKKTSVEELTRAAGISKGAFYLFYQSKEQLFFDILKQFEAEFREAILADALRPGQAPRQRFKEVLRKALTTWKAEPLFRSFGHEEYLHLLRRLPAEQVEAEFRDDEIFTAQLLATWQEVGVSVAGDPRLVTGLLRVLFFVSLHEADFGPEVFPETFDVLLELIAGYLVRA